MPPLRHDVAQCFFIIIQVLYHVSCISNAPANLRDLSSFTFKMVFKGLHVILISGFELYYCTLHSL